MITGHRCSSSPWESGTVTVTPREDLLPVAISPVVVPEVINALSFDGLLQHLGPASTELLPHLHQPGERRVQT